MPLNDFLERGCGLGYHAARLVDQNGRQENGGQNVRDECDQRYNDSDLRKFQDIFDVGIAGTTQDVRSSAWKANGHRLSPVPWKVM